MCSMPCSIFSMPCSILSHMLLSAEVNEKVRYLTTLVTLSERIGHSAYTPGATGGKYTHELEELMSRVQRRRNVTGLVGEEGGGTPTECPPTPMELSTEQDVSPAKSVRWSIVSSKTPSFLRIQIIFIFTLSPSQTPNVGQSVHWVCTQAR